MTYYPGDKELVDKWVKENPNWHEISRPEIIRSDLASIPKLDPNDFYPDVPLKQLIQDVDVTFKDLQNLGQKEPLKAIFDVLHALWVGDNKDRETSCRIGTIYTYVDKNGSLRM